MKAPVKVIVGLAAVFVALILMGNVGPIVRVFEHAHSLDDYFKSVLVLIIGAGVPITFIVMLALKVRKESKT